MSKAKKKPETITPPVVIKGPTLFTATFASNEDALDYLSSIRSLHESARCDKDTVTFEKPKDMFTIRALFISAHDIYHAIKVNY